MKITASPLLPFISDRGDENEVRKAIIDLTRMINVAADPRWGSIQRGNYSQFADDGFYYSLGDAMSWNDMIIPSLGLRVGGTAPTFANLTGGIYAYRFDAGKGESVHGAFEIMHDYKQGSPLHFHVHWCPTTTNTGNIVWGIEYTMANINSALSAAVTASMTPTMAPGVVNKHTLVDIVEIPGTGVTIGGTISFRLFRTNGGTDTFTGNAFLLSVGVHYQCDTLGSRHELSK